MDYDIVIIGGGCAGLLFARSMSDTSLKILLVEKNPLNYLKHPTQDGRETALTYTSVHILQKLGVWEHIDTNYISHIQTAKVMDESTTKVLDFSTNTDDKLGHLVSNFKIREALYHVTKLQENLTICPDEEVINIESQSEQVLVTTKTQTYTTKLIVSADSKFSNTRRLTGITSKMHDYGKMMLVTHMQLEHSHNHVAFERFDFDKTIALLPMLNNKASFVLTATGKETADWLSYSEVEFAEKVSELFNHEFGTMTKASEIYSYPLIGLIADHFYSPRVALLGDATVGMHPITAHGFNLGLKGADTLSQQIKAAHKVGIDIGSTYVLKRYEAKHMPLVKVMYYGTNIVVNLFASGDSYKPLRKLAFDIASRATPIKKAITHHLTSVAQV